MKRVKKLVLAALMVAMMAIAMVGCGSQNYDGTYIGETYGGSPVAEMLDKVNAADSSLNMTAEQLSKVVISGNNITISVYQQNDVTGTFEVDGEQLIITTNEGKVDSSSATIKDGVITVSSGGMSMTYKK